MTLDEASTMTLDQLATTSSDEILVSGGGTVTLPNTDGSTPDASQVLPGPHFGADNATQGTADVVMGPQQIADALKLAPTAGNPAAGSVMAELADKTGYSLASNGLDGIAATVPTGPAANFAQMVVQLWRRFFKKAILDHNAGTLVTYADDGTSVLTTQVASEAGEVETQGPAT